jgi:soluble lytic murein transglycosylase
MDRLPKKTTSGTPTSFLRNRKSSYRKSNFFRSALLFFTLSAVNTASAQEPSQVWSLGPEQILAILQNTPALITDTNPPVDTFEQLDFPGKDAFLFLGLHYLYAEKLNTAELLFKRALLTASEEGKMEARYRLGLLYAGMIEDAEDAAEMTDLSGKLALVGYGERLQPDARLRALLCEEWAKAERWSFVLEKAAVPPDEQSDPDSLGRIRMMEAAALAATGKAEADFTELLTGTSGSSARGALLDLLEKSPVFRNRLGRESLALIDLIREIERGSRYEIESALFRALAVPDPALHGSPLFLEAIRRTGFGSTAGRLLALLEKELADRKYSGRRRTLMLEAAGFLSRRAGLYETAFGFYDEALSSAGAERREVEDESMLQRLVWYRFDTLVHLDSVAAVEELPALLHDMANPGYFDDAFGTLLDSLLSGGMWSLADRVAWLYGPAFGPDSAFRYYYIAARAREEGYLPDDGRSSELYRRILERTPDGVSSRYYRLLSLSRSGISAPDAFPEWTLFYPAAGREARAHRLPRAALLEDLITFGLSGDAEEELERIESCGFSAPRKLVLALAGERSRNGHYLHALQRLERFLGREGVREREELELLYPRPFPDIFSRVISREQLDSEVFYALVREESHFTADIYSHAGAVGLSQLMPATAADVAGRMGLGLPSLRDLHDPALNLSIGGWYLAHLVSRTGTLADALFAYNGGLTRVRRWRDEYPHLPDDLFPEFIPFAETQHYGRKLLVSSSIYRYLYGTDKNSGVSVLVERFFPNR